DVQLNGAPLAGGPFASSVSPKIVKTGPSRLAQTAPAGSPVAAPPSVKVTNGSGVPLAGIAVAFTVTDGGGTVSPASRTTNSKGIATADRWTLGAVPGANHVKAAVSASSSVTFTATGE
ncbi:MAG TPA: hypothetical protein VEB59_10155, partial [Gemmatimonadales bacterium]|nr:hypothetical protein [Gemmatimonadales bacterium]